MYEASDSAAVKSCAASLTLNDLRMLAYCGRPVEWTEEEEKAKKRKPKKYQFLSLPQQKFMKEKPLRHKRNSKKAAMVAAYSKTAIWLSTQTKLPEVQQYQAQQQQFQEDNGTCSCCYFCGTSPQLPSYYFIRNKFCFIFFCYFSLTFTELV